MKNLQMNVKVFVEFDKSSLRPGPEFKCSICGKWFKRLLYWIDKKFNPDLEYDMVFLCGPKCATENHGRNNS